MSATIDIIYYLALLLAAFISATRYKAICAATKKIALLLSVTITSELISYVLVQNKYYGIRYGVFHLYNVIQIILLSLFFINLIKPYHHRKLSKYAVLIWPIVGLLNILFFQNINRMNSNFLLLESFAVISMSLYYIYWLLKHDIVQDILKHPPFQIVILLLLSWSGTFFFWAYIGILYHDGWQYADLVMDGHMILNIIIYLSIAAVFYFYPQK